MSAPFSVTASVCGPRLQQRSLAPFSLVVVKLFSRRLHSATAGRKTSDINLSRRRLIRGDNTRTVNLLERELPDL